MDGYLLPMILAAIAISPLANKFADWSNRTNRIICPDRFLLLGTILGSTLAPSILLAHAHAKI